MRVLFALYAEKTIFQYLPPLAWALRAAGHQVRVASQPRLAGVIQQAGLIAQPVGRDADPWRMAALRPEVVEAARGCLPTPYDTAEHPERATWEHFQHGFREAIQEWHKPENFPLVADLVSFARAWQPDLVIWEPGTFAGSIAAQACGAAHARVTYSQDIFAVARDLYHRTRREACPEDRSDPLAEWLGSYAAKYGGEFSEDLVTGHVTIDQFPASLRMSAELRYLSHRYVPYGGAAVVPDWLRAAPRRPRVALTMGLSATERYQGYSVDVGELLAALADLDVEVVATIATQAQHRVRRVPPNTRMVDYVPLHALFATCSAVIHHAGAATLATASLAGLPQLALHHHFDQPAFARRLAAHGAGLALPTEEATGPAVRDRVIRLLDEPSFTRRAAELRAEMEAQPPVSSIVPELEELSRHRRGPREPREPREPGEG